MTKKTSNPENGRLPVLSGDYCPYCRHFITVTHAQAGLYSCPFCRERVELRYQGETARLVGEGTQGQVLANVTDRGYHDDWTPRQFLLRQFVKLVEEVCELFLAAPWPLGPEFHRLRDLVAETGQQAKLVFDDGELWGQPVGKLNYRRLCGEMADCLVVLFSAAGTVGRIRRRRFDLIWAAMGKSEDDVQRGVRGSN